MNLKNPQGNDVFAIWQLFEIGWLQSGDVAAINFEHEEACPKLIDVDFLCLCTPNIWITGSITESRH